jgi:hypothetical protein
MLDDNWDNRIRRAIFDHHFITKIEKELRWALFKCYDAWEASLESHPDDAFLRRYARPIMGNLLKSKVFLDCHGWRDYCQEITSEEDVLHYSTVQLKILTTHPMAAAGFSADPSLRTAYVQHKLILALLKLLLLPIRVPEQLSTRGTGEMLLLAGSVEPE